MEVYKLIRQDWISLESSETCPKLLVKTGKGYIPHSIVKGRGWRKIFFFYFTQFRLLNKLVLLYL